jgi:3-oxoadipate CoA-transferase alpha subunit
VLNNAGTGRVGVAKLMELGRVRKVVCSFPRSQGSVVFEELYREGPDRAGDRAAGHARRADARRRRRHPRLLHRHRRRHPAGAGKETREFDGRRYVMERALKGDVALVEAWEADRWGNLAYRGSGGNFNPVMATAAELTVAQVQHIRELGEINPHMVGTPGIYVNAVVQVDRGPPWTG